MTAPSSATCPACGTPASGNFCSRCGAGLSHRSCVHCQAELSAQARFCHRCGRPVEAGAARGTGSGSDRKAWIFAGTLCVVLVTGIAYSVSSGAPGPAAPDMANTGVSTGSPSGAGVPTGPAPDISAMTPRERFDRLFNRIMQAAERRDSAEVQRFTPMALGAYRQLDVTDADARYHAAVLHLQVGNLPTAGAIADTILRESPGHLFGYLVRGEVAQLRGDSALLGRTQRDFLSHYDTQMGAERVEYLDHKPVIDEFKAKAERRKQ